jgi:hypothetical protein
MQMLTISVAKSKFSEIAHGVVRSKKPVIVQLSNGLIQIAPYELPVEVTSFPVGSLKLLSREIAMHNTFGDSL